MCCQNSCKTLISSFVVAVTEDHVLPDGRYDLAAAQTGKHFLPYGYRAVGAAGWAYTADDGSTADLNISRNSRRGFGVEKNYLEWFVFAGTTSKPGTLTLYITCLPFECVEYDFDLTASA